MAANRGAPPGAQPSAVTRYVGEHPVGLFADRTRRGGSRASNPQIAPGAAGRATGGRESGRPAGRAAVSRDQVCRRAPGGAVRGQDPLRRPWRRCRVGCSGYSRASNLRSHLVQRAERRVAANRGAPPGAQPSAVTRYVGEHPVGLFADRTRRGGSRALNPQIAPGAAGRATGGRESGRPAGRAAVSRDQVCRRAPGGAVRGQDPSRRQPRVKSSDRTWCSGQSDGWPRIGAPRRARSRQP